MKDEPAERPGPSAIGSAASTPQAGVDDHRGQAYVAACNVHHATRACSLYQLFSVYFVNEFMYIQPTMGTLAVCWGMRPKCHNSMISC